MRNSWSDNENPRKALDQQRTAGPPKPSLPRGTDSFCAGIHPVVAAEYGLADVPAALDRLDRGVVGQIVIRMAAILAVTIGT